FMLGGGHCAGGEGHPSSDLRFAPATFSLKGRRVVCGSSAPAHPSPLEGEGLGVRGALAASTETAKSPGTGPGLLWRLAVQATRGAQVQVFPPMSRSKTMVDAAPVPMVTVPRVAASPAPRV